VLQSQPQPKMQEGHKVTVHTARQQRNSLKERKKENTLSVIVDLYVMFEVTVCLHAMCLLLQSESNQN